MLITTTYILHFMFKISEQGSRRSYLGQWYSRRQQKNILQFLKSFRSWKFSKFRAISIWTSKIKPSLECHHSPTKVEEKSQPAALQKCAGSERQCQTKKFLLIIHCCFLQTEKSISQKLKLLRSHFFQDDDKLLIWPSHIFTFPFVI